MCPLSPPSPLLDITRNAGPGPADGQAKPCLHSGCAHRVGALYWECVEAFRWQHSYPNAFIQQTNPSACLPAAVLNIKTKLPHLWWECPVIVPFWMDIRAQIKDILTFPSPRLIFSCISLPYQLVSIKGACCPTC